MAYSAKGKIFAAVLAIAGLGTGAAQAAQCGNNASGFEAWKASFTQKAAAQGVSPKALRALNETKYATKTISADRNQKSFKLTLDQFMQKRGATTIASRFRFLYGQFPHSVGGDDACL